MHVVVRIKMYQDEASDSETSATSISDGEYDMLTRDTITILNNEISSFESIFEKIDGHIQNVEKKIRKNDGFCPANSDIEQWANMKGLVAPFKLEELFKMLISDAVSLKLERRMLNFGDDRVPFIRGEISLFDLLRKFPTWVNTAV